jgi:hypothetical protein
VQEIPRYLQGYEAVIQAYGYWPSFHDSPVLRYARGRDFVELEVEAWEMTSEVDSEGYFVLTKRHRLHFSFTELVSTDLEEFTEDNFFEEISFSSVFDFQTTGQFSVELASGMGCDRCGAFTARRGGVRLERM